MQFVVKNEMDTMNELIENKKSIARFGDGEIAFILLRKYKGTSYQDSNKLIREKLNNILLDNNENLLIAIPPFLGIHDKNNYTSYVCEWWDKNTSKNNIVKQFIDKYVDIDRKYYSAFITRLTELSEENKINIIDKFINLCAGKHTVLFVNKKTRENRSKGINYIFNKSKQITFILIPGKNSFNIYDDLYNNVVKIFNENNKNNIETIVYGCIGPTSTILASDVSKIGCQYIDFGHFLDLLVDKNIEDHNLNIRETIDLC